MVKVGEVAPDFSLFNHENQKVSLSQFKGTKVVLSFRDSMTQYNDLDAQVLALSVDSPFSLKLWHDKNGFTFPLLSDFNKEVIKQYGAIYDVFAPGAFNYFGVAKRSAFVIDKEGILRYVEVLEDAKNEPNYEEIQKVLASL